jgi:hypothetical protein
MAEERWILCIQEGGEPCPLLLPGLHPELLPAEEVGDHTLHTLPNQLLGREKSPVFYFRPYLSGFSCEFVPTEYSVSDPDPDSIRSVDPDPDSIRSVDPDPGGQQ